MTATGTRPTLLHAARSYYEAGYTAIPLTLDANQLPKRPIDTGWTSVPHDWGRSPGPRHSPRPAVVRVVCNRY